MLKNAVTLFAGCLLAATSLAAPPDTSDNSVRLTPRQAKALGKALEGKQPGKPVSCVPINWGGSGGPTAISDDILIYRVNKNLVYRNDLYGRCSGISNGSTLVLEPMTGQYCRNDIAHVVDLSTGIRGPSCSLGDFVPYRTPGK